jgi:hypothetical protein
LGHFRIVEEFSSAEEISQFTSPRGLRGTFVRFRDVLLPYYERAYIRERSLRFDPNMLLVAGHVYLEGYWGNEKYFKEIDVIIRHEFTLRDPLGPENEDMARLISSGEAVSIHVRRGDYISDAATHSFHGTCSLEYYQKAVQMMSKTVANPCFYVFSDDIEWCKRNLKFDYPMVYVEQNGIGQAHKDLFLMSRCRHNIIANSTFSWWGAWLNPNRNKIVVAPRRWFSAKVGSHDLVPASWIRY